MKIACDRCDGCGQIANDSDGGAWATHYENSPHAAISIARGWVAPIPCPVCEGSGECEEESAA